MSKLIKGSQLKPSTREHVLRAFVHRWTFENQRQTYRGLCPGCEQSKKGDGYGNGSMSREQWHNHHIPLVSDEQWLAEHAFWVKKDGDLDNRKEHCEPGVMADLC